MKIIFIFSCSGMFHVPGFIDAWFQVCRGARVIKIVYKHENAL